MSFNAFLESGNNVFAYCDLSNLWAEAEKYTQWKNWEQYVSLSGRWGGIMITDFWTYYDCIGEGHMGENGWDVGYCAGKLVSLFLDTIF